MSGWQPMQTLSPRANQPQCKPPRPISSPVLTVNTPPRQHLAKHKIKNYTQPQTSTPPIKAALPHTPTQHPFMLTFKQGTIKSVMAVRKNSQRRWTTLHMISYFAITISENGLTGQLRHGESLTKGCQPIII